MSRFDRQPHELFGVLSESLRLRILALLQVEELCVCDLVDIIQVPQPTISRHLQILRKADLITVRRSRRWAYYALERRDDTLGTMALNMIAWSRQNSPQYRSDAVAARSKRRPACPRPKRKP